MAKIIYSLIATTIVASWSYFGYFHPSLERTLSIEERCKASSKSTWLCQDCYRVSGIDKIRCPACGTKQGHCTLAKP